MRDCRRRTPRLRGVAWLPWLLALALLQAQALGQWHRIAHGGNAAVAALATVGDDHAPFGHAAGDDAQCRLYDAVGTAAGPGPAPELPPVLPVVQAALAAELPPPASRALRPYQARAPPQA